MRYLAAIAVIFIHCFPAQGTLKTIIDQLARFAVPFFFVTSGYLLSLKLVKEDTWDSYLPYLKRILILYFGWNLVYAFDFDPQVIMDRGFFDSFYSRISNFFVYSGYEAILFFGFSYHLWFFVSLAGAVFAFMFFKLKSLNLFLLFSALLYAFGVISYSYRFTPLGHIASEWIGTFNPRNFLAYSALPFGLGIWIGVKKIKLRPVVALGIWALGIALHFAEILFLHTYSNDILVDAVFSTFIMGVGAFLFAISGNQLIENKTLSTLGMLSLGIYGCHLLFKNKLVFIKELFDPSIWNYLYPILVVILSTLLTMGMKKIRFLKELV